MKRALKLNKDAIVIVNLSSRGAKSFVSNFDCVDYPPTNMNTSKPFPPSSIPAPSRLACRTGVQMLLAALLMISPFARAVADNSTSLSTKSGDIQQVEANNIKTGIENVQGEIEQKKKSYQSEEKIYRKRIDDLIQARDEAMTKLAQAKDKFTREAYIAIIAGDREQISAGEQSIAKLHIERNKALQELNDRISKLQSRLAEIKRQQDSQALAKATYNLTHWGETNRIVSPGSSSASDSALAALPSSAKAVDSSSPPGYKDSVRHDAETTTLRVNNTAPTPTAKPNSVATTPPPVLGGTTLPAAPQLKGEDKLLYATLNDIIEDMNKPTEDAAKRTKLLNEFLTQSEPFVASHPDYTNIWVMRAMAAMETDNVEAGWKAGQQLKRLNVLDGDDAKALKAMSGLKRKGWLAGDFSEIVQREAKTKVEASEREIRDKYSNLLGEWQLNPRKSTFTYSGSLRFYIEAGSLKVVGNMQWSNRTDPGFGYDYKGAFKAQQLFLKVNGSSIKAEIEGDNEEVFADNGKLTTRKLKTTLINLSYDADNRRVDSCTVTLQNENDGMMFDFVKAR